MLNLSARSISTALPHCAAATPPAPLEWTHLFCRQTAALLLACMAMAGVAAMAGKPAFAADLAQQAASPRQTKPTAPARLSMPLSQDVREVLDWVRHSGNNAHLPFVLVDKRSAALHLFDAAGVWQGSSPVLLGLARGDHSVPGIGERPMSQIAPHERTTPAGRFVSEPGRNLKGEDIVWVDYDDAVSLHRVRPSIPTERRLQRLASPTVTDNRISFGCINLPVSFYDRFVAPTLGQQAGVVYVLPEMQPAADFFGFVPLATPASAHHSP